MDRGAEHGVLFGMGGREGDDGLWRFSDLTFRCKGATDGWLDEQEARNRRSSAINRTVLFYGSAVGRGERRRREETGAGTRPPWGVRSRNRAPGAWWRIGVCDLKGARGQRGFSFSGALKKLGREGRGRFWEVIGYK